MAFPFNYNIFPNGIIPQPPDEEAKLTSQKEEWRKPSSLVQDSPIPVVENGIDHKSILALPSRLYKGGALHCCPLRPVDLFQIVSLHQESQVGEQFLDEG